MGKHRGASVRQRRVSAELRTLRIDRGLTCLDVAKALGCSESKTSRMETGNRGLYPDDIAAILGFLRAPADTRHELLTLVREGKSATGTRSTGSSRQPGKTELARVRR